MASQYVMDDNHILRLHVSSFEVFIKDKILRCPMSCQMYNVWSVRDRVIRVREWATAKAQAQMSTFSCPGWPLPRLPTLGWISPHRCKYVNMLTWKDVLFSSDLVALLERSKTAERRENSSSAPYKGLLWALTPASHHFLLHWAITQLGEHIKEP